MFRTTVISEKHMKQQKYIVDLLCLFSAKMINIVVIWTNSAKKRYDSAYELFSDRNDIMLSTKGIKKKHQSFYRTALT